MPRKKAAPKKEEPFDYNSIDIDGLSFTTSKEYHDLFEKLHQEFMKHQSERDRLRKVSNDIKNLLVEVTKKYKDFQKDADSDEEVEDLKVKENESEEEVEEDADSDEEVEEEPEEKPKPEKKTVKKKAVKKKAVKKKAVKKKAVKKKVVKKKKKEE